MLELLYGGASRRAKLPASWRVDWLRPPAHKRSESESAIVQAALDNPIGAPLLARFAGMEDDVAVIVPDKTRVSRTELYLPLLLARLKEAGVREDRITIVFARGTHAPQSPEVQRRILGPEVFGRYRTLDHDARSDSEMVEVGVTRAGTPVRLNRAVARAGRVLATGAVTHHYFAGFGGGPKLLMPGTASLESATRNHRLALTAEGSFHPSCRDGVIKGNPVAEDIRDAARFFPPCVYLGLVLDAGGCIARAVYGDMLAAHDAACAGADAMHRAHVREPSDLTIVSAGGSPRDSAFIQAHKALHRAHYATKEGGIIILAAACDEGFGNSGFPDWFRFAESDSLLRALRDGYTMNAHTAVAMMDKAARYRIIFVSEMPEDDVRLMGMRPAASLQEALDRAASELPRDAVVYVLPDGLTCVPTIIRGEVKP